MKLVKSITIDGNVVVDTGETFLGFKVFEDVELDGGIEVQIHNYLVDDNNNVKGIIRVRAEMGGQSTPYIDEFELVEVK